MPAGNGGYLMDTSADAGSEERLANAVERLTAIQKSVLELNQEANRIRTHIRDFDVNVDALNVLANVRSRDEKGGGAQVLEDVIRYARQTGTPLSSHEGRPAPGRPEGAAQTRVEERETSIERGGERETRDLLKLLAQLVAAAALTSGLFALIH